MRKLFTTAIGLAAAAAAINAEAASVENCVFEAKVESIVTIENLGAETTDYDPAAVIKLTNTIKDRGSLVSDSCQRVIAQEGTRVLALASAKDVAVGSTIKLGYYKATANGSNGRGGTFYSVKWDLIKD